MKTTNMWGLVAGTLVLGAATAHAQPWSAYGNYTDVAVHEHFNSTLQSFGVNADENTWSSPSSTTAADEIDGYVSDGFVATFGGFRFFDETDNPAPGLSDRAFGGDLYFFNSALAPMASPNAFTRITGLTPGQNYSVAMFSIIGGAKDTVSVSLDLGATWSSPIDQPVVEAAILGGSADWLAHSTTDALGTPMAAKDGDTRYRIRIGQQEANSAGEIIVGFRDPHVTSTGGGSDRGRIDGFAVAAVPEPTATALIGLAAAALLIRRLRS